MAYTVKQLAKISGVSVRTLHWYDEIGLLKPAYLGANGYRYYEEPQLLRLQQILFFKELEFNLNDIHNLLAQNDFDNVKALYAHREVLEKDVDRKNRLIDTIDKTIQHLRGNEKMKIEELYYGFDSEKQKEHENYLVEKGILTRDFLDECNDKVKNWSDKEKNAFINDVEIIMAELIVAMNNRSSPSSDEVQNLIRRHYVWLERTWFPTKEKYIGLALLYQMPEFRVFYDSRHPELLDFMLKAMKIFAERNL